MVNYIIAGLIGAAIVFSCISLVFNRRVIRDLKMMGKDLDKIVKEN